MAEEMVVFTRTFDLLEWLLPKSERFPRAYRSTVTQRLMDAALDLQEALIAAEARAGRSRLSALRDADAALSRLRIYLRLAHRWRWLSDGQYAHAGGMVGEIGRLLGGWLRSEKHDSVIIGGTGARGGAPGERGPAGAPVLYAPDGRAWRGRAVRTGRARAIFPSSPRPANRGRRTTPEAQPGPRQRTPCTCRDAEGARPGKEQKDVRRTHHTEPDVVVPVVRVVPVAVGRARVVLIVVPGPAAQHTGTSQRAAPPTFRPACSTIPHGEPNRQPRKNRRAALTRRPSEISAQRWATNTPHESRCCCSGRPGCP